MRRQTDGKHRPAQWSRIRAGASTLIILAGLGLFLFAGPGKDLPVVDAMAAALREIMGEETDLAVTLATPGLTGIEENYVEDLCTEPDPADPLGCTQNLSPCLAQAMSHFQQQAHYRVVVLDQHQDRLLGTYTMGGQTYVQLAAALNQIEKTDDPQALEIYQAMIDLEDQCQQDFPAFSVQYHEIGDAVLSEDNAQLAREDFTFIAWLDYRQIAAQSRRGSLEAD